MKVGDFVHVDAKHTDIITSGIIIDFRVIQYFDKTFKIFKVQDIQFQGVEWINEMYLKKCVITKL